MKEVKVWDIFVRVFHWSVVAIVFLNFTLFEEGTTHEYLGYILLVFLLFRLIWGFIGTKYARFANFLPSIAKVKIHLADLKNTGESKHMGHNPIGAVMVFNLYITLILVSFTGWLGVTDQFWGTEWVEEVHEFFANYLLLSVFLHIGGVLFESIRTGVNLISAMINGIKKIP